MKLIHLMLTFSLSVLLCPNIAFSKTPSSRNVTSSTPKSKIVCHTSPALLKSVGSLILLLKQSMKSLEKRNHTLMKQNKMLQKRLAKQSADMTKKWAQLLAFLKKKNGADAIRFTRFVKDIKRFGKVHIVKKMETLQQRCIPRKRWKKRWKIGQGLVTIHVYGCPKEYPVLRTLGTAYSRYFPQNSYFQPKSGNSADRIGCCRY